MLRALLLSICLVFIVAGAAGNTCQLAPATSPAITETIAISNQCVTFTVGSGTGCAWMCGYCAAALGPNYYFADGVCTYSAGGCVGSPVAGKSYTCCSAAGTPLKPQPL